MHKKIAERGKMLNKTKRKNKKNRARYSFVRKKYI